MTLEEINKLKEYNDASTINGIMMPTKTEFDVKVQLAIRLWPQVNKSGKIDYLFGKGVGVELALLGNVQNRKKNNCNFPYRSHSDFEIYNTLGYESIPESKDFVSVFGSQEIYPKTKTKGLEAIQEGYMDETFETVNYQGNTYLVPELELIFLDKYMRQESTCRPQGCDAILLLSEYNLDINKIVDYFERFVRIPNLQRYDDRIKDIYDRQVMKIIKLFEYVKDLMIEDNLPITFEKIEKSVNDYIDRFRSLVGITNGVYLSLCPKKIEFIEKNGKIDISATNKEQIKQLIIQSKISEEQKYDNIISEIKQHYYRLYPSVKKI